MIRRLLRFGFRLGLLAGIGLALFKLVQGRRAAEVGSPSPDWAPAPVPNPNLPRTPPEPELVKPAMLEEIIEKKAAGRSEPAETPPAAATADVPAVKKKAPAKKVAEPPAAGPVKKAAPKKVAAKKAPAAQKTPVAKKAAPVKKATKKQP